MEMYQLASDKNNHKINGEFYLRQACNLIDLYLPVSCPIIKHYFNSYYKYYEKDLDIVPEGNIVDYKINLMRNEIDITTKIACLSKEKQTILAGEEGFEPSAYGFGDRRSTN